MCTATLLISQSMDIACHIAVNACNYVHKNSPMQTAMQRPLNVKKLVKPH